MSSLALFVGSIIILANMCECYYFSLRSFDCPDITNNHEFGACIGKNTNDQIESRWSQWTMVQNLYNWIQTNQTGFNIYTEFLNNHTNKWPKYIQEMHGMSEGASFDFEKLFIMTCADELSYFAPTNTGSPAMSCSDYMLQQFNDESHNKINSSFMAHNEDNRTPNRNNTFLVRSPGFDTEIAFYAYGYAGELLCQANAWNDYIAFTANFVHPSNPVLAGYCRNFIARDMMQQKSLDDALEISAMNGQCSGHNYQIGEWNTGKSVNSEVAYDGLHAFTDIGLDYEWTFHANMYIHLNISQYPSESSVSREHTAAILGKPNGIDEMLDFLGNTDNVSYPTYKTGQFDDYTLHTLAIDLFKQTVQIYADNPLERNLLCTIDLNSDEASICT